MSKKENLNSAKNAKNDEFYTTLSDISDELHYYNHHFVEKTVLCNCDDPFESNFFKHFVLSFNHLGLKKLITTSYSKVNAYKTIITEVDNAIVDVKDVFKNNKNVIEKLSEDGDFRSKECIELLDEADIVVTNPPFSLFREYVKTLMDHNKKFLIIGNHNAITYKEIFHLLKDNKIWLGYKYGSMSFMVPDNYKPKKSGYWQDETGQKWQKMGNICWFTNLDIDKRHDMVDYLFRYDPLNYKRYDNYDAINVDTLINIPGDYSGVIGVPITFLNAHNPDQFEILGLACGRNEFDKEAWPLKKYINPVQINKDGTRSNGSKANTGPAILLNDIPLNATYYIADNADGPLKLLYARILVRNKNPK